jgi:hypothetical protein
MRTQGASASVVGGASHQGGEVMSRIALVAALTALVIAPATVLGGGKSVTSGVKCTVGRAGFNGSCTDPVGDVKGGPGPDITRVTEYQWEIIIFHVTFAKAPALAHSAVFTDVVSVSIAATHQTTTTHYILSMSAYDRGHVVLRRLPDGKPQVLRSGNPMDSKSVTLVVNLHSLGDPSFVSYRVKASRMMLDGTSGSSDYTPNTGTMEWWSG